jgi:hypothetical protein
LYTRNRQDGKEKPAHLREFPWSEKDKQERETERVTLERGYKQARERERGPSKLALTNTNRQERVRQRRKREGAEKQDKERDTFLGTRRKSNERERDFIPSHEQPTPA